MQLSCVSEVQSIYILCKRKPSVVFIEVIGNSPKNHITLDDLCARHRNAVCFIKFLTLMK